MKRLKICLIHLEIHNMKFTIITFLILNFFIIHIIIINIKTMYCIIYYKYYIIYNIKYKTMDYYTKFQKNK